MMEISFAFWVVVGYFIVMVAVGFYFVKKTKTQDDFSVANRSLPGIVVAGTLMATWMGSGTVVGGGNSLAYQYGPWVAIIFGMASPLGVIVMYFLSGKIRRMGLTSAADIIESRYGSSARLVASILMLVAYLGILSYQFTGVGFVLNVTLGISTEMGTLIALIVIIVIAGSGGLFSVAYTDFLSAILMLFGLLVGVPLAIKASGGWSQIASMLPPENLTLGGLTIPQTIGYFLPLLLLIMGDQNMYQRFFAAKDEKQARYGAIGWFFGVLVIFPVVAFGAATARALYPNIPAGQALMTLSVNAMPTVLGGLAIAAITGFVVTTGTSYILMCSVNLIHDIYNRYINRDIGQERLLRLSRISVIFIGLFAYVLIKFFPTVLSVQMYSYTMYGATITPVLLAAIVWKKATRVAGISTMIVGGVMTIVWEALGQPFGLQSVLISAPLAVITLIVVGNMTYKPKEA
jgi:SSS family solute:Na+ symporter